MGEVINMSFSDNLRHLRKQKGYSQEQLADKLSVSRQAVSKWESDSGFPEMDKLMQLSELFHCSIDTLVKQDLTQSSIHEKDIYENHHNLMSKAYTFGIATILSGVCAYLFLILFFPEKSSVEYIPETAFMCFVALGVIIFVYFGIQDTSFSKKYPIFPIDLYTQTEMDIATKKFSKSIAIGVGLILIGIPTQMYLEGQGKENIANFTFMLFVTIAVSIIVYSGTQKLKFSRIEEMHKNEEIKKQAEKNESLIGLWCGCIMMVATIIYIVWSFLFQGWHISWITFVVGGILCGIASTIISTLKNENEEDA